MSRTMEQDTDLYRVVVQYPHTVRTTTFGPFSTPAAVKNAVRRECFDYRGKPRAEWNIERVAPVWGDAGITLNEFGEWTTA